MSPDTRPLCPCGKERVAVRSWREGDMVAWDFLPLGSRCLARAEAMRFTELEETLEARLQKRRGKL